MSALARAEKLSVAGLLPTTTLVIDDFDQWSINTEIGFSTTCVPSWCGPEMAAE